ncbi:Regulator of phospholipase D [Lachnellula subtilissima]|uniref:Regulator of phospholipase D n=1 Tax=Lachnellula subtilissima TaxID=602034 RepID=A0A8H8U8X5_9HELO|nr:Regulator of phospholipase D [Lachnellula subtilissima]
MRSRSDNLNRPKPSSSSSRNTHTSTSTRAENRAAQRYVRTLPSWIDSFEEGDDASPTDRLISSPSRAHSAQHHHTPAKPHRRVSHDGWVDVDDMNAAPKQETGFFGGHKEPVKGRKWDHKRDSEPVFMTGGDNPYIPTPSSPWGMYIKSSMYGPSQSEDAKRVDEAFLQSLTPGYEKPWRGDLEGGDPEKLSGLLHSKKRRMTLLKRVQHILLMHPFVPLIFRGTVFTTSAIALGLSGSVYALSKKYSYPQTPSTTMAVVVDVVAIPYILYITWDEYTGKPLGLRSPKAKIRLVLLDLWFIIFESANLALAFASLTDDSGSCQEGGKNGLVERVGGREEGD